MPSRVRAEFQPEELTAVLDQYELGRILRAEREPRGSRRSPKLILTTQDGRFLLKRRASGRDHPMKVAFAHSVQRHLAERGFPLPQLVPLRDGTDTMVIINDRIYEMFEYVEGGAYDWSLEATVDAGRILAEFHALVSDFESDWEPARRGYHDSTTVRNHLNHLPASIGKDDSVVGKESELIATISTLYESYDGAAERINEAGYDTWPRQLVHADWHPGNMLFVDDRVASVIDYDSLRLLPAITDVANGALQFSIRGGDMDPRQWPPELDEERFQGFLAGYDEERPLSSEPVGLLPFLMVEALIAEAVMPIALTGSFGRMEGFRFLQMITRKVRWLEENGERLTSAIPA